MHDHWQPTPDLLAGRVIVVTGAGSGIGRAAALSFATHGATVILVGRTTSNLESVYDAIEHAGHPQPAIYPLNLESATQQDYLEFANTIEGEFGHLNGLLHNAALLGGLTPIEQYEPELWYRTLQVNLNGPFMMTQACLRLMRGTEDASIVFTSDRVGVSGKAYWGAYAISKFAVEGLMQVLADELETNTPIRVNCIDPGPVRTNLRTLAYPAEDPSNLTRPDQIIRPYLYLMSSDSSAITGHRLSAQLT